MNLPNRHDPVTGYMPVKGKQPPPPTDKVLDCAGRVVSLIRSGEIGHHRRTGETSLAKMLKVSRAVVRSALEHLEMAGLVSRVPRSGTFLREVSIRDFCDVMDIRAALETLAARQAADRAQDGEINVLKTQARLVDALNHRFAEGDSSVLLELAQSDLEFHLSIAEMSENRRLVTTLKQQRLIEFTFAQSQSASSYRLQRQKKAPGHLEIAEAIAARDASKAENLIRRHILRTKEIRLGLFVGELARDP